MLSQEKLRKTYLMSSVRFVIVCGLFYCLFFLLFFVIDCLQCFSAFMLIIRTINTVMWF